MFWFLIITLAYLFFAVASFGDKLILSGSTNPKLYTFYVGILGGTVVLLAPLANLKLLSAISLFWVVAEAAAYLLGIYLMYMALEKYDVSRVVPAVGAIQPPIILTLTFLFWGSQTVGKINFLAFILLFLGSIAVSFEKKFQISTGFLILSLFSALFFALDYVLQKQVFSTQSFLAGFVWMKFFSFVFVLPFLFGAKFRKELFAARIIGDGKTGVLLLFNQSAGGVAYILQGFAISLVSSAQLAVMNSLRGVQYVFLFAATLFFSRFFPKILKEEISAVVIFQKIVAILLIAAGLAALTLF